MSSAHDQTVYVSASNQQHIMAALQEYSKSKVPQCNLIHSEEVCHNGRSIQQRNVRPAPMVAFAMPVQGRRNTPTQIRFEKPVFLQVEQNLLTVPNGLSVEPGAGKRRHNPNEGI